MPANEPGLSALERLRRWLFSRRVEVRDTSMLPTLAPGDRLFLDERAYARRAPRPGDIVVVEDPETAGRRLIKRVVAVSGAPGATGAEHRSPVEIVVEGDAPRSRDSRAFGPLPVGAVRGRVWARYAPAGRRTRFPP